MLLSRQVLGEKVDQQNSCVIVSGRSLLRRLHRGTGSPYNTATLLYEMTQLQSSSLAIVLGRRFIKKLVLRHNANVNFHFLPPSYGVEMTRDFGGTLPTLRVSPNVYSVDVTFSWSAKHVPRQFFWTACIIVLCAHVKYSPLVLSDQTLLKFFLRRLYLVISTLLQISCFKYSDCLHSCECRFTFCYHVLALNFVAHYLQHIFSFNASLLSFSIFRTYSCKCFAHSGWEAK